jgi:hypothetical protein
VSVQRDGCLDDQAILAMALAYDRACALLRSFGNESTVQQIMAKRIIEVAAEGERVTPMSLQRQTARALGIDEMPEPLAAWVSSPPTYALIPRKRDHVRPSFFPGAGPCAQRDATAFVPACGA